MSSETHGRRSALLLVAVALSLAGCSPIVAEPSPAPTVNPDIYNQVPDTTVFEPGQCAVVLASPAPAHTSNALSGPPSGEIAAGTYAVGVAADYGSSLWYMLNGVGEAAFINSANVSSTEGDCSTSD